MFNARCQAEHLKGTPTVPVWNGVDRSADANQPAIGLWGARTTARNRSIRPAPATRPTARTIRKAGSGDPGQRHSSGKLRPCSGSCCPTWLRAPSHAVGRLSSAPASDRAGSVPDEASRFVGYRPNGVTTLARLPHLSRFALFVEPGYCERRKAPLAEFFGWISGSG